MTGGGNNPHRNHKDFRSVKPMLPPWQQHTTYYAPYAPRDPYVGLPNLQKSIMFPPHQDAEMRKFFPQIADLPDVNGLLEAMKCCLCFRVSPPYSFLCELGHFTCPECYTIVPGFCMKNLDGNICRKMMLEVNFKFHHYIFQFTTFNCLNQGCTEKVIGMKLEEHKENCLFRRISKCPFTSCNVENLSDKKFVRHMLIDHKVQNVFEVQGQYDVLYDHPGRIENDINSHVRLRYVAQVINCYDQIFLLIIDEHGSKIRVWMWHIDTENSSDRLFSVELIVLSPKITEGHKSWPIAVHSISKCGDEIVKHGQYGQCFRTTSYYIRNHLFCNNGGKRFWSIDVRIKEMEDPNKVTSPLEYQPIEPFTSPEPEVSIIGEVKSEPEVFQPDVEIFQPVEPPAPVEETEISCPETYNDEVTYTYSSTGFELTLDDITVLEKLLAINVINPELIMPSVKSGDVSLDEMRMVIDNYVYCKNEAIAAAYIEEEFMYSSSNTTAENDNSTLLYDGESVPDWWNITFANPSTELQILDHEYWSLGKLGSNGRSW